MAENKPFYTEEDPEAGTHAGWIADPSTAQEIANIENNQGRNDALALERSLEASGMDPIEKENNDFVDLLLEQYPFVFTEEIDPQTGERYIATSESIFNKNILYMRRFLPHSNPYIVMKKFEKQIEYNKRDNKEMINFGDRNLITLFSKHGRLFVSSPGENAFNYGKNTPLCDYDPGNRNWKNIRDLDETYLVELYKCLALYQIIGEEFKEETKGAVEKKMSIDAMRAQIQEAKDQVKRD